MKIKGILKTSAILTLITIVSFKLSNDSKATALGAIIYKYVMECNYYDIRSNRIV